jgi:hypothetical protein
MRGLTPPREQTQAQNRMSKNSFVYWLVLKMKEVLLMKSALTLALS